MINTKRARKLGLVAGGAMLAFTLASCANAGGSATSPDEEAEVIHVVSGIGAPPYGDFAEDGKTVVSYEADILAAIAESMGVEIETTVQDFDALFPAIESGRADLIAFGMADRVSRQEKYDFLDDAKDAAGFLGSASTAAEITSIEDICGYTIGASNGSSFATFLQDYSATCTEQGKDPIEVLTFKNEAVAFTALNAGQLDLVSAQFPTLAYFAANSTDDVAVVEGVLYNEGFTGLTFPKDSPYLEEFTEAFQALIDSGEYAEIMDKWGLSELAVTSAVVNGSTVE